MPFIARPRNGAAALCAALALSVVLPATVAAQDTPLRIAIVDVLAVIDRSDDGQQLGKDLRELSEQKQAEGEALQRETKNLQEQIRAGQFSLSEEKLQELQESFDDKIIQLRNFEKKSNDELGAMQRRQLERIQRRLMPLIQQVGQELGYTLILDARESGVVWAESALDITEQVLGRYNALEDGGS